MKISAFIYGLTWGGATRRLLSLLGGFAERGNKVELVVVDSSGPLREEIPEGVRLYQLNQGPLGLIFPLLSRRGKMSLSKFALSRYMKTADFDLFLSAANHAHITALSAKVLSGSKRPFVLRLSSHVTVSLKKSRKLSKRIRFLQAKRLYPKADMIIAVSRAVKEDLAQAFSVDEARIKVVYNPVYSERLIELSKQPPGHPWLLSERGKRQVPVLLAAGRLRRQKGFSTIIKAVKIASSHKTLRLIILGEGKARRWLKRLIKEMGMETQVDMPGFVQNPISFMARADLFCHASTFEGLPGVVIEALATGCPVVCTDSPGGAREILEGGKCGLLVPVGDANSFSKAILEALDRRWQRDELISRARDFSLENAVKGYLSAFDQVLYGKDA